MGWRYVGRWKSSGVQAEGTLAAVSCCCLRRAPRSRAIIGAELHRRRCHHHQRRRRLVPTPNTPKHAPTAPPASPHTARHRSHPAQQPPTLCPPRRPPASPRPTRCDRGIARNARCSRPPEASATPPARHSPSSSSPSPSPPNVHLQLHLTTSLTPRDRLYAQPGRQPALRCLHALHMQGLQPAANPRCRRLALKLCQHSLSNQRQ